VADDPTRGPGAAGYDSGPPAWPVKDDEASHTPGTPCASWTPIAGELA
jgi:hypothetical protein